MRVVKQAASLVKLAVFEWSIASGLVRAGGQAIVAPPGRNASSSSLHGRAGGGGKCPVQQPRTGTSAEHTGVHYLGSGVRSQRFSSPYGRSGRGAPLTRRGP